MSSKKLLRKEISTRLKTLTSSSIAAQSTAVVQQVFKDPDFNGAKSVALYMNLPGIEIDTLPIIQRCFDLKKDVFLPICSKNGKPLRDMTFLQVKSYSEVLALEPTGKYKIREPALGPDIMDVGNLGLIIVPGVAFTPDGKRLGHGAGYYDRFLSGYKRNFGRKPFLIGLSFTEQMVLDLPTEPHDWPLDRVYHPMVDEVGRN